MGALLELIAEVVVNLYFGAIPERQPWRRLVAALYLAGALAGLGALVWLVVGAV